MLALLAGLGCSAAPRIALPAPAQDIDAAKVKGRQKAVLAGGCFWCTEAVFEAVAGVEKVVSGYSGGDLASATYEMVGSGRTRHAESIAVTDDPAKISYGRQWNRQGPDCGPQYRSAIFYATEKERRWRRRISRSWSGSGLRRKDCDGLRITSRILGRESRIIRIRRFGLHATGGSRIS
jgi:peptide-methionine (S)-S-oxide reductase